MAQFNLADYAETKDRIGEFVSDFPDGSIQTFLRFNDGPEVIFEARVYRDPAEVLEQSYTSGWAREIESAKGVNLTSHVENCETSAIGRALANLGYGTDKKRPSRDEMIKVARMEREKDDMLDYIRECYDRLTDESEGEVEGNIVKLKGFILEQGVAIKDQFRLARSVTLAIEKATAIPFAFSSK